MNGGKALRCPVCGNPDAKEKIQAKKVFDDHLIAHVGIECRKCGKFSYKEKTMVPVPVE